MDHMQFGVLLLDSRPGMPDQQVIALSGLHEARAQRAAYAALDTTRSSYSITARIVVRAAGTDDAWALWPDDETGYAA